MKIALRFVAAASLLGLMWIRRRPLETKTLPREALRAVDEKPVSTNGSRVTNHAADEQAEAEERPEKFVDVSHAQAPISKGSGKISALWAA
jgi:hypothetical protein